MFTAKAFQTYDLAIKLRDALANEMNGEVPKMVLNKLHRKFLDPSLEEKEATFNEPIPLQAYKEYHDAISEAISSSLEPAFLLDIHSHGYTSVNWTMLGK